MRTVLVVCRTNLIELILAPLGIIHCRLVAIMTQMASSYKSIAAWE